MTVSAEPLDRARGADLLETARCFVKLKRCGAEWIGPCPVCGGTDRFSVHVRKRVWNCRHCDGGKGGDVISRVQHALGVSFGEAIVDLSGKGKNDLAKVAKSKTAPDPKIDEDAARKARWLWAHRRPLAGSVAETYLRQTRGYKGLLPASLGFLKPAKPEHHPCLIAAFGIPEDPEPGVLAEPKDVNSVHLTKLKPDGSGKADVGEDEEQKIALGSHAGLPVVLAPVNDLLGLAICEGIEDALSAAEAGLGAWAACGANFMPKLAPAVPSYVECITIFAHPDEGLRHALELERLLIKSGFEVRFDDGVSS